MTCPRCGCTIRRTWPSTATRCTTTPPPPLAARRGTPGSGGKASCTIARSSIGARGVMPETCGAAGDVRVDGHDLTTYTGIRDIFPYIRPSFLLEEDNPLLLAARQTLENMLGRPFRPGIWGLASDGGH